MPEDSGQSAEKTLSKHLLHCANCHSGITSYGTEPSKAMNFELAKILARVGERLTKRLGIGIIYAH